MYFREQSEQLFPDDPLKDVAGRSEDDSTPDQKDIGAGGFGDHTVVVEDVCCHKFLHSLLKFQRVEVIERFNLRVWALIPAADQVHPLLKRIR